MTRKGTKRTCPEGHVYYKSSDCPTCPKCEEAARPESGFLSKLSAPARRALQNEGITSLEALSRYSESEILDLHGMGPSSIPTLEASLKEEGLGLRDD